MPKPQLPEKDGTLITCYSKSDLIELKRLGKNWGGNVELNPLYTFVPKTKEGICEIIAWAKKQEPPLQVRVSGYRHTWNHVYSDNNQILISLLGLHHVNSDVSATMDKNGTGAGVELKEIRYVEGSTEKNKIFCKIGGAVTNDELREFCTNYKDPYSNNKWCLPLNVVLVENTFAGTISSICHGSGAMNKTLSDLVMAIEFVNAKGKLQTITAEEEPELIKVAAGSFGLLGVITSITFKLDRMEYALTDPKKIDLLKAIPPIKGTKIADLPKRLVRKLKLNQESLDAIIKKHSEQFFDRCHNDHYAEWFWFILQDKCWVNTWKKDSEENYGKNEWYWEKGGGKDFAKLQSVIQGSMTVFAEAFDKEGVLWPKPPFQESNVCVANGLLMGFLPTKPGHPVPVSEALHFQRGIRHVHARNVEIEIPIAVVEGKPDWSICQKAWWDAISIIYNKLDSDGYIPINLAVEMRIMGGSDITMAAQRGNQYTCSIEVLSSLVVPYHEWKKMVETIIEKWTSYRDNQGMPLAIRTHWAKEWDRLQFGQVTGREFVRNSYQKVIPEFLTQLEKIAKKGGYTLEDIQRTFSNELWDEIIFGKLPQQRTLLFGTDCLTKPGLASEKQDMETQKNAKLPVRAKL